MEINEIIKSTAIVASSGVLIQQVIAAFIRARKTYDAQDELMARRLPIVYDLNKDAESHKEATTSAGS